MPPLKNIVVYAGIIAFIAFFSYAIYYRTVGQRAKVERLAADFDIVEGQISKVTERILRSTHSPTEYSYEVRGRRYETHFMREVPCRTSDEALLMSMNWRFPVAVDPDDPSKSHPILYPEDYERFGLEMEVIAENVYDQYLRCTTAEEYSSED